MTALQEEGVASPAVTVADHLHTWHLVADDDDGYGQVRYYECNGCEAVRYL